MHTLKVLLILSVSAGIIWTILRISHHSCSSGCCTSWPTQHHQRLSGTSVYSLHRVLCTRLLTKRHSLSPEVLVTESVSQSVLLWRFRSSSPSGDDTCNWPYVGHSCSTSLFLLLISLVCVVDSLCVYHFIFWKKNDSNEINKNKTLTLNAFMINIILIICTLLYAAWLL